MGSAQLVTPTRSNAPSLLFLFVTTVTPEMVMSLATAGYVSHFSHSLRAGERLLVRDESDRARVSMCDSGAFGVEDSTMIYGSTAFLVGADIKQNKYKTLRSFWTLEDSLAELRRLCETAGLEVLGEESQNMQHPNPSTFIGQGKLEEVAAAVEALKVETVIFDDELSPAQQRNIQAWPDRANPAQKPRRLLPVLGSSRADALRMACAGASEQSERVHSRPEAK
eukprot:1933659-Pleurochrysis_carterae.AAC.1